jgi:hypothetical protein
MSYFGHHYASNSDIKEIVARSENRQKPENIQDLYDMGTETHSGVIEPHKMRVGVLDQDQIELINVMSKTFWKDKMCRDIMMAKDLRREYEFYRVNRFGLQGARCKADSESKRLQVCLELKGLGVTTEKGFRDSIMHHDYDQATAWYLNTMTGYHFYRYQLIVGLSKKQPDLLFKMLIDRNHQFYKSGMEKVRHGVMVWKQNGYV